MRSTDSSSENSLCVCRTSSFTQSKAVAPALLLIRELRASRPCSGQARYEAEPPVEPTEQKDELVAFPAAPIDLAAFKSKNGSSNCGPIPGRGRLECVDYFFRSWCCWSVYASPFSDTRAQSILFGCSRSTIESYPEAEKQPLLQYLDGARATADSAMQLITEGKIGELYEMMSAAFKEKTTVSEFARTMATLEQRHGRITRYEYRDQGLQYSAQRPIDLQRSWSEVWFAVEATSSESKYVFVSIRTKCDGEGHVLVRIHITWSADDVPTWFRSPDAPVEPTCPQFPGHIEVKPSVCVREAPSTVSRSRHALGPKEYELPTSLRRASVSAVGSSSVWIPPHRRARAGAEGVGASADRRVRRVSRRRAAR